MSFGGVSCDERRSECAIGPNFASSQKSIQPAANMMEGKKGYLSRDVWHMTSADTYDDRMMMSLLWSQYMMAGTPDSSHAAPFASGLGQ